MAHTGENVPLTCTKLWENIKEPTVSKHIELAVGVGAGSAVCSDFSSHCGPEALQGTEVERSEGAIRKCRVGMWVGNLYFPKLTGLVLGNTAPIH